MDTAEPTTPAKPKFRARNMSPIEEHQERCRHVLPPRQLPDHIRALLQLTTQYETVEKRDGVIRLTILDQRFEFYSQDSLTCQNRRGERVLVAYSLDFMDVLFVLSQDKRHLETVPRKGQVGYMDHGAAAKELAGQQTVLKRSQVELAAVHGEQTQRRLAVGRRNIQKIDNFSKAHIAHTFDSTAPPNPSDTAQREAATDRTTLPATPATTDRVTFGATATDAPVSSLVDARQTPSDRTGPASPLPDRRSADFDPSASRTGFGDPATATGPLVSLDGRARPAGNGDDDAEPPPPQGNRSPVSGTLPAQFDSTLAAQLSQAMASSRAATAARGLRARQAERLQEEALDDLSVSLQQLTRAASESGHEEEL